MLRLRDASLIIPMPMPGDLNASIVMLWGLPALSNVGLGHGVQATARTIGWRAFINREGLSETISNVPMSSLPASDCPRLPPPGVSAL